MSDATIKTLIPERTRAAGVWERFVRNRRAIIGGIIFLALCVIAIFAPLISPYPPEENHLIDRLQPPSSKYLMGTDELGRDILSRAIYGCRVSIPIGLAAMLVAMFVGVSIGLVSGFAGGWVDSVLMRFTDLFLAFPVIFLLLTVAAIFGRSITILILMLGLTSWGSTARIVRGEVLSLKERPFIEASRSIGSTNIRILLREILPNTVPIIAVAATLRVTLVILVEGGLSFLGLGVQPPTPSWGNMISDGREFLRFAWWATLFPGIFLFLCTMGLSNR
jgi:peptide/nickel transport system permease protein